MHIRRRNAARSVTLAAMKAPMTERVQRVLSAMPRAASSLIIGALWAVWMSPIVFFLGQWRRQLIILVVFTALGTAGFHWTRVVWGDAKGTGRGRSHRAGDGSGSPPASGRSSGDG